MSLVQAFPLGKYLIYAKSELQNVTACIIESFLSYFMGGGREIGSYWDHDKIISLAPYHRRFLDC